MLGALETFDLGILECCPIRLLFFEAADIALHDVFDRNALKLFRARMAGNAHGVLLGNDVGGNLFSPLRLVHSHHPEVATIGAFTRVFDALWRPSKDAWPGPSSFEARCARTSG